MPTTPTHQTRCGNMDGGPSHSRLRKECVVSIAATRKS
jgi:hypothetical protein